MKNKHDLDTYSKLAQGGTFFINESFKYIDEALRSELASIIYGKLLDKVEPTKQDLELANNLNVGNGTIETLQSKEDNPLTDDTISKMSNLWEGAISISQTKTYKFGLDYRIKSIELLGHLNNLGFFIETLTNRHLLFLNQSGEIDNFCYSRISIAKIMERLIFIFKDDLTDNKIQLNEITNLFSLRNKTVHYTPDNAIALKPRISDLIAIWRQCKKLVEKFEKVEKFNEEKFSEILNHYTDNVKTNWT